ncbi:peptidoglycan glycosyltransferase [Plesiocystis pacifica SIR-1]|uniref:Peptidoglycan glycosyltransferase n=1 Tax=Plesiocystis pacifica SIR-1 TaxID=391625 RepID=A6G5X6_9BACT|nr:penicillin-binding transpeptidase domain-containing protein [Plesiocystis pacifica]EDM78750.1 peptidoglycan glycosyltransferase [Plesiocystis pacifica SIR-1]
MLPLSSSLRSLLLGALALAACQTAPSEARVAGDADAPTSPSSDPVASTAKATEAPGLRPSSEDAEAALDAAFASFEGAGAVVLLDVDSGELLGARERPGPDLAHPLLQAHSPASTVKPLMTLAALDAEVIDADLRVPCGGREQDLREALATSCNQFAYVVGDRMGAALVASTYSELGFGAATGLHPDESPGKLPTTDQISAELAAAATGHGALEATPLQLAQAYRALARSSSSNRAAVFEGMLAAVEDEIGTARVARIPTMRIAGKTGTATLEGSSSEGEDRYDGWFVALAPAGDPEIVVVVFAHDGGIASNTAVPAARALLESLITD